MLSNAAARRLVALPAPLQGLSWFDSARLSVLKVKFVVKSEQ
jgi:hypothetical protein